ncbi:DMT family transporter [Salinibacterium sp. ZJ454]|uniref:DMT family transporter n=1 Tax=Salinibacterium sp. ZJ454 TaxID=2708339 RepID=UPI001FBBCD18|nr:DMT family transporter [Salinibacterium sp. ZJ454]
MSSAGSSSPTTPARTAPPKRARVVVAVALAVAFGAMLAVQSKVNGDLGQVLGDGYLTALISFGSGMLLMVAALPVWAPGRRGLATIWRAIRSNRMPWWYTMGGAAGAVFVASQSLTAAVLGVAVFTIAAVSGQVLSGLGIDRSGLGSMPATRITLPRLIGSALALAAVVLSVSPQFQGDIPIWMLVLPFIAGLGQGFQQALNGELNEVGGSAFTAGLISSAVGTVLLIGAAAISVSANGWPDAYPTEWWLYTGGVIGVVFVAGAAIVVRFTGVLLLGLGMIAGQLVMSLLLDLVVPTDAAAPVHPLTIVGAVLTLAAVLIAAVPSKSRKR